MVPLIIIKLVKKSIKINMQITYINHTIDRKYRIMIIEQIYTGCLAQGAYYIESNGEVAIIDPLREVQDYLDRAT